MIANHKQKSSLMKSFQIDNWKYFQNVDRHFSVNPNTKKKKKKKKKKDA